MNDRAAAAIVRSVLAGALSGMRSAAGPALAARQLRRARVGRKDHFFRRLLAAGTAPGITGALAVGELLADKHPRIPDRTEPPALLARAAAGALAAAALVSRRASPRVVLAHALIGAGAAVLSTQLGFRARRRLARGAGAGPRLVAFGEDAVAYGGGALALHRLH